MKTKEKSNKGITLVALVVTIIILLILAGMGIQALTQTGLFNKAKDAKQKSENAQTEENITLGYYKNLIEKYGNLENSREALINESTLITNIDFEASEITSSKITLKINASTKNENDAVVYYVFCNGKVVTGGNSNIIDVINLSKNTEYNFKCGVIDINGNIKISSEKRYKTGNVSIDEVEALDYALITSTGIYNCKLKNSNEYYLFKDIQLTGKNAIGYEGYDNNLETSAVISNTVDVGYIYVDESAIEKKIMIKGARNCYIEAMDSGGKRLSYISSPDNSDNEMIIPKNTKYLYFTTYAKRLGDLYFNEIMVEK